MNVAPNTFNSRYLGFSFAPEPLNKQCSSSQCKIKEDVEALVENMIPHGKESVYIFELK
jgi:hypothetical protein